MCVMYVCTWYVCMSVCINVSRMWSNSEHNSSTASHHMSGKHRHTSVYLRGSSGTSSVDPSVPSNPTRSPGSFPPAPPRVAESLSPSVLCWKRKRPPLVVERLRLVHICMDYLRICPQFVHKYTRGISLLPSEQRKLRSDDDPFK